MPKFLKISEAAALALHSMVLMAGHKGRPLQTREAAERLGVSAAHLSKVLQRLSKSGLVKSMRGPDGGFVLNRAPGKISLLNIYEAMEGPMRSRSCLFDLPACPAGRCILGGMIEKIEKAFIGYLSRADLSGLADVYEKKGGGREEGR